MSENRTFISDGRLTARDSATKKVWLVGGGWMKSITTIKSTSRSTIISVSQNRVGG